MRRKILHTYTLLVFTIFFLFIPTNIHAAYDYEINSFDSEIVLQKNTDLVVTEKIIADFNVPKHGIFRIVPVIYSARGRTINAEFDLLGITDGQGNDLKVQTSKFGRSVELKIGDPNRTITGQQIYVINYTLKDVVRRFDNYDEVYWNVTGSEWDTSIAKTTAGFVSEYAKVADAKCYAGAVGSVQGNCAITGEDDNYLVTSEATLGSGKDLTVVFTLDKDSQLVFPTKIESSAKTLKDNWGYPMAFLPIVMMLWFWFKKGRDKKFTADAVYYEPEKKESKNKSIFAREHIPLIYHPIDDLTPSEAGTIVDEKVDIEDVMAEIVELSRLGYMKIVRVESGGWLKKDTYAFVKDDKDQSNLRDYQKLLLKEIFRSNVVHDSVSKAEKIFKGKKDKLNEARKLLIKKEYVLNTALEEHFYTSLPRFKKMLYEGLSERGYFDGNPDKVRTKWIGLFVLIFLIVTGLTLTFVTLTGNFGPMVISIITFLPGIFIAYFMPRKTAKGYMYARQAEGLRFYLRKGEWRYEIQEKKLFLEEMLPLAISLGVVDKLTKDMSGLGVRPPSYTYGFTTSAFSTNFRSFQSGVTRSMMTAPGGKWSGSGSWSGGSGFSGGSSGGGFGGGGGGSW
ncbi:DUF2207 domain-containing protein [Candidatus Woesebacteria bacterium]|nr:DUF2207 domain-containing protein [Candidatus Woesebacteria bacterium]